MATNLEEGTAALDQTFLETTIYHNRVFQSYAIDNLAYLVPIDEEEEERLHIMHNVFSMIFEGRLLFAPINRPRRVLDLGHGTGSWAFEVAEHYSQCEVLGIDICPTMQPRDTPANLYLQVDDVNRSFSFEAHQFDLVQSRMMAGAVHYNRWTEYVRDMLRVTRPGGWVQMIELSYNFQSDNGTLTENHALRQWSARYNDSMHNLKDVRVATRLQNLMREVGFVDVESRMIQLPTCAWPTAPRENEIGVANRDNVQRLLNTHALFPFTERLQMPIQDVHLLIAQTRVEADDPAFRAYLPLWVCIGRKSRGSRR